MCSPPFHPIYARTHVNARRRSGLRYAAVGPPPHHPPGVFPARRSEQTNNGRTSPRTPLNLGFGTVLTRAFQVLWRFRVADTLTRIREGRRCLRLSRSCYRAHRLALTRARALRDLFNRLGDNAHFNLRLLARAASFFLAYSSHVGRIHLLKRATSSFALSCSRESCRYRRRWREKEDRLKLEQNRKFFFFSI